MADLRTLVRDEMERAGSPSYSFDDLGRRRDRRGRNRRIAAGVVGIAVFVAAIGIVTSVGSFDRTQTPAATGPAETGPAVPGPAETGPALIQPPVAGPATGEPHVVGIGSCSDGASSRLVLTLNQGLRIDVSFELHRSPTGDAWRISVRRNGTLFFRRTKTANDSGDVEAHPPWFMGMDGRFRARAIDRSTGEVCWAHATI